MAMRADNYLNLDETCERLLLDRACVRRFVRWNWLSAVRTTTGILVHRRSVEALEIGPKHRLEYAQLHCRKGRERRRLQASQGELAI